MLKLVQSQLSTFYVNIFNHFRILDFTFFRQLTIELVLSNEKILVKKKGAFENKNTVIY